MPDVTDKVTVDGVEPSILVKLLDVKDNPHSVKIFTDDRGGHRNLYKGGNAVLVTPTDLSVLGGFAIEIVDQDVDDTENLSTGFASEQATGDAPTPGENKVTPIAAQNAPENDKDVIAVTIPDKPQNPPVQQG